MIADTQRKLRTFHAAMHVTRVEHWCVEAESEEEAAELFACGKGHRCSVGERIHAEFDALEKD